MTFAETAARLAGIAARLLGWRPAEFWSATPAELALCLADPSAPASEPLSREAIRRMMERDENGR
jgi:hypothetical protein